GADGIPAAERQSRGQRVLRLELREDVVRASTRPCMMARIDRRLRIAALGDAPRDLTRPIAEDSIELLEGLLRSIGASEVAAVRAAERASDEEGGRRPLAFRDPERLVVAAPSSLEPADDRERELPRRATKDAAIDETFERLEELLGLGEARQDRAETSEEELDARVFGVRGDRIEPGRGEAVVIAVALRLVGEDRLEKLGAKRRVPRPQDRESDDGEGEEARASHVVRSQRSRNSKGSHEGSRTRHPRLRTIRSSSKRSIDEISSRSAGQSSTLTRGDAISIVRSTTSSRPSFANRSVKRPKRASMSRSSGSDLTVTPSGKR